MHEVLVSTSSGPRRFQIDESYLTPLGVSPENASNSLLFVSSWLALLADSPLTSSRKPPSLFRHFLRDLCHEGLKATVLRFTRLSHEFVSSHGIMGSLSSTGEWCDDFRNTPVFFEYNHYYKTGDVGVLRYIYEFLNFGKKLEYSDETFYEVAFRDWTDIEIKLAEINRPRSDILSMKTILRTILPTFTIEDYRPKLGPGSVAEKGLSSRIPKLQRLRYDALIDRFLFHGHIGRYGMGEDQGLTPEKVIPDPSQWTPARSEVRIPSEQRFVPKNLKVARSIGMEPNDLMYHQQGVGREMNRLIQSSCLGKFIRLDDQSINRRLAEEGSYTFAIDTIDLSAASDSVGFDLVREIFPPSWLIPMIVTRSRSMNTVGGLRHLNKFAPMGSALCFPTQCIVFTAVCIYAACIYAYGKSGAECSFDMWLTPSKVKDAVDLFGAFNHRSERLLKPLAVYGDDICVDSRLTHILMSILDRLGFSVNRDKSFTGSQSFRESCGGYYLNGTDITPLYYRIKGVKKRLTASHVASHVDLINKARARGRYNLYRFLHSSLMSWEPGPKTQIPYTENPDSFGIICNKADNSHLQRRLNVAWQRYEFQCITISYTRIDRPGSLLWLIDKYEYTRWWTSRNDSVETAKAVRRYDTRLAGLRWRWIPAEN